MAAQLFVITYPTGDSGYVDDDRPGYNRRTLREKIELELQNGVVRTELRDGWGIEVFPEVLVGKIGKAGGYYSKYMDDSYWVDQYSVWTGEKVEYKTAYELVKAPRDEYDPARTHYHSCVVRVTVDADEEVKVLVAAYEAEVLRVAGVKKNAERLVEAIRSVLKAPVNRDEDVEVYKGRKVPKGKGYWVTWVGESQFGPYANLICPKGTMYKFVALTNLRPTDWSLRFAGIHANSTVVGVLRAVGAKETDADLALLDAIQDAEGDLFAGFFKATWEAGN